MLYLIKKMMLLFGRPKPVLAEDPWGQRPDRDGKRSDQDGPPDLDELLGRFIKKTQRGNHRGGGNGDSSNFPFGDLPSSMTPKGIMYGVLGLLLLWLATGFYTIREREQGVELFLGAFHATKGSGLNWFWPAPIGRVEKVDVQSIQTIRVGEFKTQKSVVSTTDQRVGQMLTKDENIVEIGVAVQYRIGDAKAYLFEAQNPDDLLREVVISAIREVVGANAVDDVLTDRRGEWPQESKEIIIKTVREYGIGLEVVALEVQDARAPAEVQDAFEDAVRAREDEERLRLQAEAFTNERIPLARGQAEQIIQAAEAYVAEVVAKAEGDSSHFNSILRAYNLDPDVLRERLYLETLEKVYADSPKVFVDSEHAKPIVNLGEMPVGKKDMASVYSAFASGDEAESELKSSSDSSSKKASNTDRSRSRFTP